MSIGSFTFGMFLGTFTIFILAFVKMALSDAIFEIKYKRKQKMIREYKNCVVVYRDDEDEIYRLVVQKDGATKKHWDNFFFHTTGMIGVHGKYAGALFISDIKEGDVLNIVYSESEKLHSFELVGHTEVYSESFTEGTIIKQEICYLVLETDDKQRVTIDGSNSKLLLGDKIKVKTKTPLQDFSEYIGKENEIVTINDRDLR